jgi:phage terminase small subunit
MGTKKPSKHKLNKRQKLFVRYYVSSGMVATQAAIKAGYSEKTARTQGCALLTNQYIKDAIQSHVHDLLTDTENLSVKWLQQTMAIAGFDIRKAVSWDKDGVEFIDSSTLDDQTAFAIQEVSMIETEGEKSSNRNIKVKAYDKTKALDLLGKFLGIVGGDSFAIKLEDTSVKPEAMTTEARRERIAELRRKLDGTN